MRRKGTMNRGGQAYAAFFCAAFIDLTALSTSSTCPGTFKPRHSCTRTLQDYLDRTGLPLSSIDKALQKAEAKGLITRDWARVRPTERGFDFLSDLQELFLAD